MINLRIIGDVHGHYGPYHNLLKKAQHTIQVGDFGFDYRTLSTVDHKKHKVLGGNHDNYNEVGNWPHFLGNYGVHNVPEFGDIFFIRGGLSIDRHLRTKGISWWPDEELSIAECYAALTEYTNLNPHFVVSHECPQSIVPHITNSPHIIPSRTNQLLEAMFATHKPKRWIFGHYHKSRDKTIDNTYFTCLDELECLDL